LKRKYVFALAALAAAAGCGRGGQREAPPPPPAAALGEALVPSAFARALARVGGGHFHAVARLRAGPASAKVEPRGGGSPAGDAAATDVTTTTDVWVDRAGNYRMREENDRDGGREVVLYGRELSVALRYGRMIRRVAEEPEPRQLLEQGLGAPGAVFELCAAHARVTRAGSELYGGAKATVYEVALGDPTPLSDRAEAVVRAPGALPLAGLRAWRASATFDEVSGRVAIDDASGAVVKADLVARFSAKAEGGPITGGAEVHALLTDVAATPAIERPPSEELASRQRIVPEQRELLHGIAEARVAPEPAREPGHRPAAKRAPVPDGAVKNGSKGAAKAAPGGQP
jgi:hypothetical protein